jgi:hypothetical protein
MFPPFFMRAFGTSSSQWLSIFLIGDKMTQEHSLATLFQTYAELEHPPILELLNIENNPVGALYMSNLKYKNFVISETNNSEKYYLYIDGIGIYFSFYRKISL